MTDPTGLIITTMKTANIASRRVSGGEEAQGVTKEPKTWQRYVVLTILGRLRAPRAPVQTIRYGVNAYAPTHQDAWALYGEISDLWHNAGPMLSGAGVAIHNSLDEEASTDRDPVTGQPVVRGVIEVIAGTALVTV